MPICIAGMHRSGTSLIARLLNLCGLDLGPADQLLPAAPDNPEGFWENRAFVSLNQDLMEELGGGWHAPPDLAPGWQTAPEMAAWREKAARLPAELGLKEPWGWKDPRSSVTLPLWREVFPDLRVVICVRHPLEVASSLLQRNQFSLMRGLRLWLEYYRRLVETVPADRRIVTHYERYFVDAARELGRVASSAQLHASDSEIVHACSAVASKLRHSAFGRDDLESHGVPDDVSALYRSLCAEADWQGSDAGSDSANGSTMFEALRLDLLVEKQQARLVELEEQVLALADDLDQTQHRLNASRLFADRRDRWARILEQRLASGRHRMADRLAGLALRVTDPLGRKRVARTIDDLLGEKRP